MSFINEGSKRQTGFLFRYALQSLGIVVVLAILIRAFLFSSYAMSGTAMLPSVWPGDFLLGSKMHLHQIRRGDVVALRCPLVKDKFCLKRVIGLPGDRIEFHKGVLSLNGQQAHYFPAGAFATEVLGQSARAIWPTSESSSPTNPVVVPPQAVYLMNDKRSDMDDSRAWGAIPQEFLEARIIRVWVSLDWFDGDQVRVWPRLRTERLLRSID